MISVVCVYNNKEILDNFLLKSLKAQTKPYELILLNNENEKYKSAAEALNEGGKKAKSKYIMFVHQDIDLKSDKWLEETEKILNSLENFGVVGVAGKIKGKNETITRIKQGNPPKNLSNHPIEQITKVQTVDECLFIVPKTLFCKIKFDEKVCDGWHLYAVDYSLKLLSHGFDVYVIPTSIYHKSVGYSLSDEYYVTVSKLLKKYDNFDEIHTTMGTWCTKNSFKIQKIKQKINWNLFLIEKFFGRMKK